MPYVSNRQRRFFHWARSQGKISPKVVHEFDEASKGMNLPETAHKKEAQLAFEWFLKEASLGAVSTVAVLKDGKMLLGKRRDNGKWTNPGGHLNPGEDPEEGAKREVMEEAGLKVKNLKKVGQRKITTKTGKELMIHAYTASPIGDKTSMKEDPDQEVHRWHWVDISKGLPDEHANNLHSPNNVLLQSMGLQEMKKEGQVTPGLAGLVGGITSGHIAGKSAAGTTANSLSRKGSKTTNEEIARNVARVTAPLGALGGLALGLKHKEKLLSLAKKHISAHPDMHHLYEGAIPFLAGTGGGIAAGAGTGALTSLRGRLGGSTHMQKEGKIISRASLAKYTHGKTHERVWKGFTKKAAIFSKKPSFLSQHGTHMAELAGLGTLAAPTIQKMRGKPMSEKAEHRTELGGLGILAGPSALHLAKGFVHK